MMGEANAQRAFFYNISLETFVPGITRCAAFARSSMTGLGITSDRKLVMELQCNMALRWFVWLNLDEQPWDASTFSQNRRRRFDEYGILERLFDETVAKAMMEGLVSRHVSAYGTLVRANASYKSFVPIELAMAPEEYKRRLRAEDADEPRGPQDPAIARSTSGARSGATPRSLTDPDCRFVLNEFRETRRTAAEIGRVRERRPDQQPGEPDCGDEFPSVNRLYREYRARISKSCW
jgi:hypothetical protein